MKTFDWCGYSWNCCMEGGRIIHPKQSWMWFGDDVITENTDGSLTLSIEYNPRTVIYKDKEYNSKYEVSTFRSTQEFSYGTFSCEVLMPEGKNLSASFWLTGSGNWPPEIDIEEGWTDERKSWFRLFEKYPPFIKPSWRTTTNVVYRDDNLTQTHIGSRNICWFKQHKNPAKHFIEYKCEWLPDKITFYANGKVVRKVGKDVANKLTENVLKQGKGFKQNVVFDLWCENPEEHEIEMTQPMRIRNFKYEPIEY